MADYRREYGMSADQLAALSAEEFRWLLTGLSEHSRFAQAWRDAPKNLYDQADIAAVTAAARR